MSNYIVVHPEFDRVWPFAADHLQQLWAKQGPVEFRRLDHDDDRNLCQILADPAAVTRLISLGVRMSSTCIDQLHNVEEAAVYTPSSMYATDEEVAREFEANDTVVSEDSVRIAVDVEPEGDALELTVDGTLTVVDVKRSVG